MGLSETGLKETEPMETKPAKTGTMEPGAAGKSPTRISESSPMPRDTG